MKHAWPARRLFTAAAALAVVLAGAAGCGKSESHQDFVAERVDQVRTQHRDLAQADGGKRPELVAEHEKLVEDLCADLEASRSEEEARRIWREANPESWPRQLYDTGSAQPWRS